jgi:hypothetical protein
LVNAIRLLFVGNSFTARNDLPGLVAKLAEARGKRLEHRLISAGGASLRMHWNRGDAQRALAAGTYDYVILQEQSTLPMKNAVRFHENVRLFDEAIRAAGAKTALYMTWARRHEPQNQKAITEAYRSIGAEVGALVIPVGEAWTRGEAWERFLAEHASPVLHDADGSHPTLAATYLAACCFLKTLFGEDPHGLETVVAGLSEADAVLLQQYV